MVRSVSPANIHPRRGSDRQNQQATPNAKTMTSVTSADLRYRRAGLDQCPFCFISSGCVLARNGAKIAQSARRAIQTALKRARLLRNVSISAVFQYPCGGRSPRDAAAATPPPPEVASGG